MLDLDTNFYYNTNKSRRNNNIKSNPFNVISENVSSIEADELDQENSMMNNIYNFNNITTSNQAYRNKKLLEKAERSINYTNDMLSRYTINELTNIVESALMLDDDYLEKANITKEDLRNDIKSTISDLVESVEFDKQINEPRMISIIESISARIPSLKTGVLLEKEDIDKMVNDVEKESKVQNDIDSLVTEVKDKVATLVTDDKKTVKKIQEDLDNITKINQEDEEADESEEDISDEELDSDESDEEVDETALEDTDEVSDEELDADVSEEEAVDETDLEDTDEVSDTTSGGQTIHIGADGATSISIQNTNVSMNSDGSVDINVGSSEMNDTSEELDADVSEEELTESGPIFIENRKPETLLEALALNEGMNMIKEGKSYDSDIALANAIKYITILETLDTCGIAELSEERIGNIVNLCGGTYKYKR